MGRNTTKGGDAEEREKGGGAEEREVGADASSTLDWALCEDEASELVSFLYCNETAEWARDSWAQLQSDFFKIDIGSSSLTLRQPRNLLAVPGNTGSKVWDAGVILAKAVEAGLNGPWFNIRNKVVVEIGSGCGLLSIAATILGAKKVYATDLADMLPTLSRNIAANVDGSPPDARELCWGVPLSPSLRHALESSGIDFVFASDCIFNECWVRQFVSSLVEVAEIGGPCCRVIVANELRSSDVSFQFLKYALRYFQLTAIPTTALHPDYRPRCGFFIYLLERRQQRNEKT